MLGSIGANELEHQWAWKKFCLGGGIQDAPLAQQQLTMTVFGAFVPVLSALKIPFLTFPLAVFVILDHRDV